MRATFPHLKPHTTYHYILTAENSYGKVSTSDQTVTTEESAAEERADENCPNAQLREENNSLSLPDCRAYEQATEPVKNGGEAAPGYAFAMDGERVFYISVGLFANAPTDPFGAQYVANRTPNGWITQPVLSRLTPGTEPLPNQELFSPDLNRWAFLEASGISQTDAVEDKESGYFSFGQIGSSYTQYASPILAPVEGGPRQLTDFMTVSASSDDLSHLFISTSVDFCPAPQDPRPDNHELAPDRIYEISEAGGSSPQLHLAAEVPSGLEGSDGCLIDQEFGRSGQEGLGHG